MKIQSFPLWETVAGAYQETPQITHYAPDEVLSDAAVIIFPGGAYYIRAPYEGDGYARFLAEHGIHAFVVDYRVFPYATFPLPLLDARRAVRYVRYHADTFGIDKQKIAVMGSSAGGHLAALVSTYTDAIEGECTDEVDAEPFLPSKQILCYPVINLYDRAIAHEGCSNTVMGRERAADDDGSDRIRVSPNALVSANTPEAFIWHTCEDETVDVRNSLEYVAALKQNGVAAELHVFPYGPHGLGLATTRKDAVENHVAQWGDLLLRWLRYIGW